MPSSHRVADGRRDGIWWRSEVGVRRLVFGLWAIVASVAPVSAQDASLRAVATRVDQAPDIDGILDEPFWETLPVISDFVQREPVDGAPASERTEVRIAYDEGHLYFGFILYDSEPELLRRSILHREGRIDQDDHIWIGLDTYNDDRNGYIFELNSFGTQGDALFNDESMTLDDWNWEGVYASEARVTDEGWTLEVAIPFTTIRFSDAFAPEMGIAIRRAIRRKNEEVFWPHIPQEYRSGFMTVSQYATLTGLQDLRRGRYMEVKPFAIAGVQRNAGEPRDVLDDIGVDFKYALTSNLALDLTYNTDFAQVEADNVQINLTRFSLFFPEKREFFLERAGLFSFGKGRDTEVFFSRRIGRTNDIIGGGRLTGQVGPLSIGVLSLQTDDLGDGASVLAPGANNSVLRLRADVMPRTTLGGIFTSLQNGDGHNRVVGADTQVRFWNSSSVDAWVAHVRDSDDGGSTAGAIEVRLQPERWYSLTGNFQSVEEDFDPALGFVRRRDMVKYGGTVAYTPRFEGSTWARSLVAAFVVDRVDGQDGEQQSSSQLSHNMLTFQTGDFVSLNLRRRFERLAEASSIQGRALAPGDYDFFAVDGSFRTNQSRTLSGSANLSVGDFWNGDRTSFGGSLTWKTGPFLTLTGSTNRNVVRLPVVDGEFSTTVVSLDVLGAVSRNLFANALVQWDDVSKVLQANVRIDWIHTPGSDLFLVLDTGYLTGDLMDPRDPRWLRRTGVAKLTYLKAF